MNRKKFFSVVHSDSELHKMTWNLIIRQDQLVNYPEVVNFFLEKKIVSNRNIPAIVTQLNISMDKQGVLRVASKFDRWSEHSRYRSPILLSKNSHLTILIVQELHSKNGHSGIYSTLNELRRDYYVPSHFSVV